MNTVGNVIKVKRIQNGMSGIEFAKKIGISNVTLCKIEKGKENPSLKTLKKVSDAFGICFSDFMKEVEMYEYLQKGRS